MESRNKAEKWVIKMWQPNTEECPECGGKTECLVTMEGRPYGETTAYEEVVTAVRCKECDYEDEF